jgi:hypothetical protein
MIHQKSPVRLLTFDSVAGFLADIAMHACDAMLALAAAIWLCAASRIGQGAKPTGRRRLARDAAPTVRPALGSWARRLCAYAKRLGFRFSRTRGCHARLAHLARRFAPERGRRCCRLVCFQRHDQLHRHSDGVWNAGAGGCRVRDRILAIVGRILAIALEIPRMRPLTDGAPTVAPLAGLRIEIQPAPKTSTETSP